MQEQPEVLIWDFAYPAGKSDSQGENKPNCFTTEEPGLKGSHKNNVSPKSFYDMFDQAMETPNAEAGWNGRSRSKMSSKSKSKALRHQNSMQTRTYLLSVPTPSRLFCSQIKTTISTMLLTPHTQLILLVPQSHIICPKVCEMQRYPRAGGSGLQVVPVPPTIPMECSADEAENAFAGNLELLGVDEVATKLVKCTKVKRFDGYLAFEDERANWVFLEKVGKSVKKLAGTK